MLDQSQTITVATTPRTYNVVEMEKSRVTRRAELSTGEESLLTVDHQKLSNGAVSRHLHKLETGVVGTASGQMGNITITVVVTAPKWVEEGAIVDETNGFVDWVSSQIEKTVNFRS